MNFLKGMHRLFIPSIHNDYQPHLLRRGGLMFFLALALCIEGYFIGTLTLAPAPQPAAVIQSELIRLTNKERVAEAAAPLQENELLSQAAQRKAQDMATRGYFSHNGPDGTLPWEWLAEVGYSYTYAGENLAVRFEESEEVVTAWMDSPSHRANIVKPLYTEIGIGVAEGTYEGLPAVFVVQFFGTPSATLSDVQDTEQPVVSASDIPSSPTVAAAQTGEPAAVSDTQTLTQTLERFFGRIVADPAISNWALMALAGMLALGLLATFFIHIQIQHSRMLMGGFAMTLFVAGLFFANQQYFEHFSTLQSAAVINVQEPAISEQGYWIVLE